MTWRTFKKKFLYQRSWFNKECRSKTYKAFRRVVPKLPPEAIPYNLIVFAPHDLAGSVAPVRGVLMYLDASLEADTQAQVDFTVAHEFAHIVRDNFDHSFEGEAKVQDEKETDKLAESWGIMEPPENDD